MSNAMDKSTTSGQPQQIIVQTQPSWTRSWLVRILGAALGMSVLFNIGLFTAFSEYFQNVVPPLERYHSGSKVSSDKIAILDVSWTIMPPYTERLLKQIDRCRDDDHIKGVLLSVDSPGGLVADSHQIYDRLKKLSAKKPVYVQMKRLAASGGYYISMGAGPSGKIYAEPTTWTGSIGVIIPRYDFSKLADQLGVKSDPLKTGEFKDALSPFHPLTENEKKVWANILEQSYQQFMAIIDENRDTLDADQVKAVATGEVFTAADAKKKGLVDEIGFTDDAIQALQTQLNLKDARVITYESPKSLAEQLMGGSANSQATTPWQVILESSVPRAYFYFSWFPPLPQ